MMRFDLPLIELTPKATNKTNAGKTTTVLLVSKRGADVTLRRYGRK
jgi:hypothetical protein